jgi:hypothetical protein
VIEADAGLLEEWPESDRRQRLTLVSIKSSMTKVLVLILSGKFSWDRIADRMSNFEMPTLRIKVSHLLTTFGDSYGRLTDGTFGWNSGAFHVQNR